MAQARTALRPGHARMIDRAGVRTGPVGAAESLRGSCSLGKHDEVAPSFPPIEHHRPVALVFAGEPPRDVLRRIGQSTSGPGPGDVPTSPGGPTAGRAGSTSIRELT